MSEYRTNRTAVIVAGGMGLRMGGELPKQFLPIGGKPILMHTLEAFRRYDATMQLILVLPRAQQLFWKQLCQEHAFTMEYVLVDGGDTRFQSVRNGLERVSGSGIVGVHDGVRPFVSQAVIARCYETAQTKLAVVPVVDMIDSIRRINSEGSETVPREMYKLVQTPQVFDVELLKRAYAQGYRSSFTDDASVVEALGVSIALVEGNRENIKMTTPFDLNVGASLLTCLI